MKVDAIVIGGGANGLVAAVSLARAGRKVWLLEQSEQVGGLAVGSEFHPGFTGMGVLQETSGVDTRVLARLGLPTQPSPPVFVPQEDGRGLLLHDDPAEDPAAASAELDQLGDGLSAAYREYRGFLTRLRPLVRGILEASAPPATEPSWPLLRTAIGVRRLGERDMLTLLRIGALCVDDWLEEYFPSRSEGALLRAALIPPGLRGTFMGPRSPTSATTLLLAELGRGPEVVGGGPALIAALDAAAGSAGVEVRTRSRVAEIRLEQGRVCGVRLSDGTAIDAPLVISAASPRRTLLDLLPPAALLPPLDAEVANIRARGSLARVHLALRAPLRFSSRPGEHFERVRVGEHPLELERTFDAVKLGEVPVRPTFELRQQAVGEQQASGQQASGGRWVAAIDVPAAPGLTDRAALGAAVLERLAAVSPEVRDQVVAEQVLLPSDIARLYGADHPFHGELALDQLWVLRPIRRLAQHRTPIPGLYLGSMGCHGGAGITCRPGAFAAQAALTDRL